MAVRKLPPGIGLLHSRTCASSGGARCNCTPTYRASVWSKRDGKKIRRTFAELADAKMWRADATVQVTRGGMRVPAKITLREAAEAWVAGVESAAIRTRSGDVYKPSALRGYESALRLRVLPALGGSRLSEVSRADLQDMADRLLAAGHSASTIRNTFLPLRAIFGRAVDRGELVVNPTTKLRLPAVRGRRDRIADVDEAERLLEVAPARDRALWATAFYTGLRRGELQALSWGDVDLAAGKLHVRRSWDPRAGYIEPKSRAGKRVVPIPAVLRDYLDQHRLHRGGAGLVFGRTASTPFDDEVQSRADRAWANVEPKPLPRITMHECRHTYASLMIAAGVNAKALSSYMGHSSITITLDRYGHLMPGNEAEAAGLLDEYLARANTSARVAQLER